MSPPGPQGVPAGPPPLAPRLRLGVTLCASLVLGVGADEARANGEAADAPARRGSLDVRAAEALDVRPLNLLMQEAAAAGQVWPTHAFASAAMLTGFSSEVASLSIAGQWAGPEGTGPLTVITVSDGLLDDSVRGEWRRYVFERRDDGSWQVVAAERAWRCRRGEDRGFGVEPCP